MNKVTQPRILDYYITWSKQKDPQVFEFSSARDEYYLTQDQSKIFDLSSTSYHASFGHSFSPIIEAIKTQMTLFSIASPKSIFNLKDEVSKLLLDHLLFKTGKIFYTVSGAEAIENAIKMARQIKNKKIILAREDSYHGATLGALSLTGDWRNNDHFTVDEWTRRIPSPKDDPLLLLTREIINKVGVENIAAICLETITGGNGIIHAPISWWKNLQSLCKEYNIFLILDEVVCGFNRTIKNFAFHHYQIRPDFVCMAKGITGGYIPFGAVYTSEEVANYYQENVLSCGLTNYAHPIGLNILKAILKELNDSSFQQHLLDLEKILIQYKEKFKLLDQVRDVRQIGLLMGIETKEKMNFKQFLSKGILVSIIKHNIIIAPPYIMTSKNLINCLETIYKTLEGK